MNSDDEIAEGEIIEPSEVEPVDHFAGAIDHIEGLREIRDGILRADDQRLALVKAGDVDGLANGAADLAVVIKDLATVHRSTRADLANILIARHEAEGGGSNRRPKVEVEGLGVVEVPGGNERKNWRSVELLRLLIVLAIIDTETGEPIYDNPLDAAQAIGDVLVDCLPVTASLGWRVGQEKPDGTMTGLRKYGIDLDQWSDLEAKERLAEIPKRAS